MTAFVGSGAGGQPTIAQTMLEQRLGQVVEPEPEQTGDVVRADLIEVGRHAGVKLRLRLLNDVRVALLLKHEQIGGLFFARQVLYTRGNARRHARVIRIEIARGT